MTVTIIAKYKAVCDPSIDVCFELLSSKLKRSIVALNIWNDVSGERFDGALLCNAKVKGHTV